MPKTADLLATGWRLHQAGDLPRAEQAYRQLVEQEPGNAQGWYLLGVLCQARGDLATAAAHLEQALRLRPTFVEALNHRGMVFARQGQLAEAAVRFHQALELKPGHVDIQTNLGLALVRQGRYAEGIASLQAVLQQRPDHARAQTHLREALAQQAHVEGLDRLQQGKLAEAEACFHQALRIRPDSPEVYYNLGNALAGQGKRDEAIACYQQALRGRPDFTEAHNNLGLALRDQERLAEAEASYRAALRLRPDMAEAHNNLGALLMAHYRFTEAAECGRRAVQLAPDFAPAHNNLGLAWWRLGRYEEALASFAEAVRLDPDYADPHWNGSLVRLLLGDYEQGWSEHQWRWQVPGFAGRPFTEPRWDGSPPAGRTILLHAEDGLGDTIQFVRYARLVKEQGATVLVECQRELLRLLARCSGIDQFVARGDPLPPHEVRASLLSLPYHFRTRVDTIPATVPYLTADPALVEHWQRELAALSGFKIGINWQGNPQFRLDKSRSMALEEFAPLAQLPGVQLVSLQHGPAAEQLRAVAGRWPITDLGGRLDEEAGPFMDRAAVMKNLDLIVTSDTSIAHLAGALGVPVWVALGKVPYWCYLLEREDTPWYPTMRLFRQERVGEWRPVFERIAHAVQQRRSSEPEALAKSNSSPTLQARIAPGPDTEQAEACNNQGVDWLAQQRLAEARACFERAVQLDPGYAEAYSNLSVVLRQERQLREAEACCRQAVQLRPDLVVAHNNLGVALQEQQRPGEALVSFERAVQLDPAYAEAHSNRGGALWDLGRFEEAAVSLREALGLRPQFAEAWDILGSVLRDLERFDEAQAGYARALQLQPDSTASHLNAAHLRLLLGDFAQGWAEYEWRWQQPDLLSRVFDQPRWDGSPLSGRTILLYAEQGFGDTIQFARYAQLVKERGATVIVECPRALLQLLARCPGIDQLVAQGDPLPPYDVRTPFLSLPHHFRMRLATIPARVPYLSADPALVEHWRQRLTALPGFKIGINWQGNPQLRIDRRRSIPLAEFAPLAALPGVQLVSLQHGPASEQLTAAAGQWPVTDLGGRLDEAAGPFMDRAAVMKNLDLVVTSDTSIAHLAGALGVPVWVALGRVPDWRWLLEREDSPWYPTMRLFRQECWGEWGPVFRRMAQSVQQRRSSEPEA
jgi:tetratricopeptide (TPR) repeat protein